MTAWRDEPDDQMIGSSVSQPMALTYTSFRRPSMSFESKIVCFLFMVHIRFRFCTTEMCCGRFRLKHVISAPRVKSTETIWSHNGPVEIMQSLRNTRVLLTRNDPGETKVSNVSDSHTQTHLQLYNIGIWLALQNGGGLVGPQVFHPNIFEYLLHCIKKCIRIAQDSRHCIKKNDHIWCLLFGGRRCVIGGLFDGRRCVIRG